MYTWEKNSSSSSCKTDSNCNQNPLSASWQKHNKRPCLCHPGNIITYSTRWNGLTTLHYSHSALHQQSRNRSTLRKGRDFEPFKPILTGRRHPFRTLHSFNSVTKRNDQQKFIKHGCRGRLSPTQCSPLLARSSRSTVFCHASDHVALEQGTQLGEYSIIKPSRERFSFSEPSNYERFASNIIQSILSPWRKKPGKRAQINT